MTAAEAGPPRRQIPAFLGPKTVAPLAHHTTHDIELSPDSVKRELPRIMQQLYNPASTAAQQAVVRRHFAVTGQLSHPLGYAVTSAQIACLMTCLYLLRSLMVSDVEIIPVSVVFDADRLTAALDVKAVLHLRLIRLNLPLLAQVFCELAPRREKGSSGSGLIISHWSEHWSLRSLATLLPGMLAGFFDWTCRRAVARGAEALLRMLSRLGWAQWVQEHHI